MSFDSKLFQTTLQKGLETWHLDELHFALPEFLRFAELIAITNPKLNLTRLVEAKEMAIKNFLDSLVLLHLKWPERISMLDLGTGAGFPGIPLALCRPKWEITLLDSLKKKLAFLDGVIRELSLDNCTTLHARAEDLGRDPSKRESYDLVVSRAVASLPVLLELAIPLIKVGGYFVAYKSAETASELEQANVAMEKLNAFVEQVFEIELPYSLGVRNLLIFKKSIPTPSNYPRRAGIPQKRPLK